MYPAWTIISFICVVFFGTKSITYYNTHYTGRNEMWVLVSLKRLHNFEAHKFLKLLFEYIWKKKGLYTCEK